MNRGEPVRDPFMSLDKVNAQDCLRQEALAIASIEIVEPLRTRRVRGQFTASIELRMTPTGRPGTLTVQSVSPTTLLSPPTGASWTVGVTVAAGTGLQTITLPLRAARCDLHAIGEDKLGTVLPVTVQVGGGTGVLSRPSSPPMRRQIHDFLAKACGREG